jgi:hypothetical protein
VLNWIAGYAQRWAGFVEQKTIDLVHWCIHALAGVVYTVFGNVGKAWGDLLTALKWLQTTGASLVGWIVTHLTYIVTHDIPQLVTDVIGYYHDAINLADRLYQAALAGIKQLSSDALQWVKDAEQWVIATIWDPLVADVRQLRSDLLQWGYAAWQLLNDPAKLAGLLLGALIAVAEATFWQIAGPAGTFMLRLITANLRRLLQLAETILAAVL